MNPSHRHTADVGAGAVCSSFGAMLARGVDNAATIARQVCVPAVPAVVYAATAMPRQYSSTAQDLARGNPTEIDHLNGFVVRRGTELGVPTPVNPAPVARVKLAEAARAVD